MTIISFIKPANFNWDVLRSGVELGDDATDEQVRLAEQEDTLEERKNLKKASRIAMIVGGGIVFCIVILWPMPMYGSRYVFSKQCNPTFLEWADVVFTGWVVVEFIWLFLAALFITCFPLWESRASFVRLWKLLTGQVKLSAVESVSRDLHGKVHADEKTDSDTKIEEDQFKNV